MVRTTNMVRLQQGVEPGYSRPRRHRRFALQYPVRLTVQGSGQDRELEALSRNLSIGGLLLETTAELPDQTYVRFVIKVSGGRLVRPINISGEGVIVRVETADRSNFRVAVACDRPMIQIENLAKAS